MSYEIKKHKNNLHSIYVDTGSFPTCSAFLMVKAGSRHETKKNNGIAHFFEHMAFKGSRAYPDSYTVASTIEGLGGVFNAFTSKEYTCYWIKAPLKHFGVMTSVIADMVQNPLLKEGDIEKEKGVIIEEINMYEDMPQRKVMDIYESIIFNNHPLGFDTIGTKQTVSSFKRSDFQQFIQDLYAPSNSLFVVAGGLGKDKYYERVNSEFNLWKDRKAKKPSIYKKKKSGKRAYLYRKETQQAHLVFGYEIFGNNDKRKYALSVAGAVLGGGMSSRLFIELREKRGLCYYVGTGRELYAETGTIYTRAGVPVSITKVEETIKIIAQEHLRLAQKRVGEKELNRAKELIKGNFLLSLEDTFNTAFFYARRFINEGKIITPEQVLASIDAVTAQDVLNIAEYIISNPPKIVGIGPFDKRAFSLIVDKVT